MTDFRISQMVSVSYVTGFPNRKIGSSFYWFEKHFLFLKLHDLILSSTVRLMPWKTKGFWHLAKRAQGGEAGVRGEAAVQVQVCSCWGQEGRRQGSGHPGAGVAPGLQLPEGRTQASASSSGQTLQEPIPTFKINLKIQISKHTYQKQVI